MRYAVISRALLPGIEAVGAIQKLKVILITEAVILNNNMVLNLS